MKSASLQTVDLSKASSLSTWKATTKVVTRNVGSLQKQWLNNASLYLVLSNITCPPGQRFWSNRYDARAIIGQVVIHEKLIVTFKGQKKVRHRSFNTKSLPFRFEIQPQDEIEDIQVDPFSSLPPTMSSLMVPSAFTSFGASSFDHQPSSMPNSPFHGSLTRKHRLSKMSSLNRESSQRSVSSASFIC